MSHVCPFCPLLVSSDASILAASPLLLPSCVPASPPPHWVLDVCFRENEQRHWAGNSAQNLGWLRKMALCLLKAAKHRKGKSITTRRHLAGWKNDYLLSVLAQIPENSGA